MVMDDPIKNNRSDNLKSIYPEPVKGFGAPLKGSVVAQRLPDFKNAYQPDANPMHYVKTFFTELVTFLIGLCSVLFLVLIVAYPLSHGLISHSNEYFGNLDDFFSIVFVVPIILILFAIVAFIRRDWTFIMYPIVVFILIGPLLYKTDVVEAVASTFPFRVVGARSDNQHIATALISYALIYSFDFIVSRTLRRGRFNMLLSSRLRLVDDVVLGSILLLLIIASPIFANKYITNAEIKRKTVRMPQTNDFIAFKPYAGDSKDFVIQFVQSTKTYNGNQQYEQAEVHYTIIEQGKGSSVQINCGDNYTLQKTPKGHAYGTYVKATNSVQPPRRSAAYNEYNACFVYEGKTYTIQRNDRYGNEHLQRYPVAQIIDSFFAPNSNSNINVPKVNDSKVNDKIYAVNPSIYNNVGELVITEWGIKFPLTSYTSGATYTLDRSGNRITVSVPQNQANGCGGTFVGNRVTKEYVSSITTKNTGYGGPYRVISNYVYTLGGSAPSCSSNAQDYEDSFNWSVSGITAIQ